MKCENCGKELPRRSQFCQYCGQKIEKRNVLKSGHNPVRTILIVTLSVVAVLAVIYFAVNESKYVKANSFYNAGEYQKAWEIFEKLESVNYRDSRDKKFDSKRAYALSLTQEGTMQNYKFALSIAEELEIEGYSDSDSLKDEIQDIIYNRAIEFYKSEDSAKAIQYLNIIRGYKDSDKYYVLSQAHSYYSGNSHTISDEVYYELLKQMDFEDTKDVLLKVYPYDFLLGNWKTSDNKYYFKLSGFNDVKYNLPCSSTYGSNSNFEDGVFFSFSGYNYSSHELNPKNRTDLFRFSIIDKNEISVYSYMDGAKYTLYRQ